ncbi:MAG: LysR family transcriptional regulator [Pseudomonadota bacterium]
MEFNQIRYFLAVADCLNFTQAADRCAVSQPALSKAIKKLEDDLGSLLFNRNTNEVMLTEFGELMRIHFERIEESRRSARHAANIASGSETGTLEIGVMCTINAHRFTSFFAEFSKQHPQVRYNLHDVPGQFMSKKLLEGELDCVFCARAQNHDPRFTGVRLYDDDMVVAFNKGHKFSQKDKISVTDFAEECFLDRLNCEFREQFLGLSRSSGIDLNVVLNSEREDWIIEFIQSGFGIGVISKSSIQTDDIDYRMIEELRHKRVIELVMTKQAAAEIPTLTLFHQFAMNFNWESYPPKPANDIAESHVA